MEKKRRRRRQRQQAGIKAASSAETKQVTRWMLSPQGCEVDSKRLTELPSMLMSDVLVELLAPYIAWPPASDELADLEAWLELGADVWNVTVEAEDGAECAGELVRLAAELDHPDAFEIVAEIARRKFGRFASDQRRVASVRVIAKNGRATVETASVAYLSGRSR